jgi:lipopolysaccharide transport system permease protein
MMSVEWARTRVEADAAERVLRVACELRNTSGETWRADDGFSVGWQLYDPDSGCFISEGDWQRMEDLPVGAERAFGLRLELPPESGRYHIYVSPRRESAGWEFRRGSDFLLVDAAVHDGRLKVLGSRVASLRGLRFERLHHSLAKALVMPFQSIWRNRALIRTMVRRDIVSRYRGSFGDVLWTLIHPLLLMATYFFVFGIVLRTKFGSDQSTFGFAFYFLAGMLPWLAFSEAVGRSPYVVLEHRNFVKKLVFPVETLPVNLALAGLVTQAFATAVFTLLLGARGTIPSTVLWLPALLIPQFLFTLGLCWFLAALGAYVRDLGQVMGFLLTLWFFLTPICYPETLLPPGAREILAENPIYMLVSAYRAIFLEGSAPDSRTLWRLWAVGSFAFFAGHAWFYKLKRSFTDVI